MAKSIRFAELVKTSGKPELVSLWADPSHDRAFIKAVKANRVLTLVQAPASKKPDFGKIGFHREPYASYLVFPKPLPKDNALRVIGIKYHLISQPRVFDPVRVSEKRKVASPGKQRPRPKFEVLIRRMIVIETAVTIENVSGKTEAKREAIQRVKAEPFDPAKAVIRHEVLNVEKRRI